MMPHQGAGAGQAVEDCHVLARCLNEYFNGASSPSASVRRNEATSTASGGEKNLTTGLEAWMQLYQNIRLPRAQKVAKTSKEAGETYQMVTDELKDVEFEEALGIVKERIESRMKWIWTEDIGMAFVRARDEMLGVKVGE